MIGNVAELREQKGSKLETNIWGTTSPAPKGGVRAPGWCGQRDDESLQQPSDVGEGVLPSEEVEEERQQDEAVHKQAGQDRDEVHAQLLSQVSRIVHVQDLPRHQEHDTKGEVPAQLKVIPSFIQPDEKKTAACLCNMFFRCLKVMHLDF